MKKELITFLTILTFGMTAMPLSARNTLTVADGTTTDSDVPIYGIWGDHITMSQFIIPASDLAAMQFGNINKLTFHASNANVNWGVAEFNVYLTETNETTVSVLADYNNMTQVYAGTLSISNNIMEVTFTNPYTYMGGNLMIGFLQTVSGTYSSCDWYGVSAIGASMGGHGTFISQRNFLPKTTFAYFPGTRQACMPVTNLSASNATTTGVTLTWADDNNSGATYSIYNIADSSVIATGVTTTSYDVTGLTPNTGYTFGVEANCSATSASIIVTVGAVTTCADDGCSITIVGADSYGDGWNGNAINVIQGGATIGTFTLTDGSSLTETFTVCSNASVSFSWVAGSYPGEVSFEILDGGNTTVFTGTGSNMTGGAVFFTLNDACPSCLPVTGLTVDTVTETSIAISWNGTAASYAIYNGTTFVANVTTNTYTFTSLSVATSYTFGVQAICSATDTASMVTINVTTDCADITTLPYNEGFENGFGCWSTINGSSDGQPWLINNCSGLPSVDPHGGSYVASSWSYVGYVDMHANAWLISPKFVLPNTTAPLTFSWWELTNPSWPDHYSVAISTTTNDTVAFTTIVYPYTQATGTWTQRNIDLSAYAGQSVYIAFHHVDYDMYYLFIDDIEISQDGDSLSCPGTPTVTDYDGNIYNTVKIGNQCWMKENLRVTHYADGITIPAGSSNTSTTDPYYYSYSLGEVATYGYYYNWPAAMHGTASSNSSPSNVQGVCPNGWHLPSDAEWSQLTGYVSSQSEYTCGGNSNNIARALASTEGWNLSTNNCAVGNDPTTNNATYFSAVPGGQRDGVYGGYHQSGIEANFWSSTESDTNNAWNRQLLYSWNSMTRPSKIKSSGFHVRCLLDQPCSPSTSEFSATTCDSYTWNGQTYTMSGNYTQTFINMMGCDSVVTLHLTITQYPSVSISGNSSINHGQSTTITASGANTYAWSTGATNASITVSPTVATTYTVTGTNEYGCTATASKTITVNPVIPTVTTYEVFNISSNSATSGGDVTSDGGGNVTARGVCWSTSPNPMVSDMHTMNGGGTGDFTSSISNLTPNTTYYLRAYATNSVGTAYGATRTFTTTCNNVSVTISGNSSINHGQSTTLTASGANSYVWSTGESTASITVSPTTTTTYSVTGTNQYGCTASATKTVTVNITTPTVITSEVTDICSHSAISGGEVTHDGGATVLVRGVCWNTSPSPTVDDSFTSDGSGTDVFTSVIEGLTRNTTYYLRAYAANSAGIAYGNEVTFTTAEQTDTNHLSEMIVYPNPASDVIHLLISDTSLIGGSSHLFLYDAAGHRTHLAPVTDANTEISCAGLNQGVYFLELNVDGITVKTFKIIIKKQ